MTQMTFEQFRATRTDCPNLAKTFPEDGAFDEKPTASGLVYLGQLYIEEADDSWLEDARARGKWCLILGNAEFISDDLTLLERRLYEFAQDEGFLEA